MSANSIANKLKTSEHFFNNIYLSFIGYFKILILSKYKISLPIAKQDECIILGNGPSLKQTLDKDRDILKKSSLFCVNNFATTPEFFELKPSHYVMLDSGFFLQKERTDVSGTFKVLKNQVDWALNLFVPYIYRKDEDLEFFINSKSSVKIVFFNYTVFSGFDTLAFNMYKKNLAMPQFNNVLGASIFIAINMGYKKINIAGADHSWFENIMISNDNVLCRKDLHFYDIGEQLLFPIIEPTTGRSQKIGDFFHALSKIFNSYYLLNQYAIARDCSIYNLSPFSYIDAFERKKEF
jgi:hypothetical protein